MSEEHFMGPAMTVAFFTTIGPEVPQLEPIVVQQWDPGFPLLRSSGIQGPHCWSRMFRKNGMMSSYSWEIVAQQWNLRVPIVG
jgi:hypothetical protein